MHISLRGEGESGFKGVGTCEASWLCPCVLKLDLHFLLSLPCPFFVFYTGSDSSVFFPPKVSERTGSLAFLKEARESSKVGTGGVVSSCRSQMLICFALSILH